MLRQHGEQRWINLGVRCTPVTPVSEREVDAGGREAQDYPWLHEFKTSLALMRHILKKKKKILEKQNQVCLLHLSLSVVESERVLANSLKYLIEFHVEASATD